MAWLFAGLLAVSIGMSATEVPAYNPEPTVNLSAIRLIECDEGSGSGFMIGDNTIATAGHVAALTHCIDAATGAKLTRTIDDPGKDFAVMAGTLPKMPYIKYSCDGYKKGRVSAYGISAFRTDKPLFRQVDLVVKNIEDIPLDDGASMKGLRKLKGGYTVPGMSGGPHIQNGYAVGITNVGRYREQFGIKFLLPTAYGRELKDTFLCKAP